MNTYFFILAVTKHRFNFLIYVWLVAAYKLSPFGSLKLLSQCKIKPDSAVILHEKMSVFVRFSLIGKQDSPVSHRVHDIISYKMTHLDMLIPRICSHDILPYIGALLWKSPYTRSCSEKNRDFHRFYNDDNHKISPNGVSDCFLKMPGLE